MRERLGVSLGERPPTLVPVTHVMMCMNCGCDFSLTLRRHHCHACGKASLPVWGGGDSGASSSYCVPAERGSALQGRNCSFPLYRCPHTSATPQAPSMALPRSQKKIVRYMLIVLGESIVSWLKAHQKNGSHLHTSYVAMLEKQGDLAQSLEEVGDRWQRREDTDLLHTPSW